MSATTPKASYFTSVDEGNVLLVKIVRQQLTDEDNIDQFGQELFTLVDKGQHRRIIVDLARLDYVTSGVLGKFITLHRKLRRQDGALVLCRLQPHVRDIMKASRLLEYFQTADSLKAARELLAQ